MHRRHLALVISCAVTLVGPRAEATCMSLEDGCSVCCAGGDDCYTTCPSHRDWEPRDSSRLEAAFGSAGGMSVGDRESGRELTARVSIGYHRLASFSDRNLDDVSRPRGAWCAPLLLCGGIGIIAMPIDAIVGNERGIDVIVEHAWTDAVPVTRISAKPVFRVARDSRWRTASFVGALAPELGIGVRGGTRDDVFLRWSPYPIDFLLARRLALTFEPLSIGVAWRGDTGVWIASSLALRGVL